MSTYDRWKSWSQQSWGFYLFQRHHSELNDLYWAHFPALVLSEKHVRQFSDEDKTAAAFALTGANKRRAPEMIANWKKGYRDFQNWNRLNALMALSSYFEVYLQTVVALSIESNPGLRFGSRKRIDGVAYLKELPEYSAMDLANGCVKGEWSSRIAEFGRIFGMVPTELRTHESDLEWMRNVRNGVGHYFGRDLRAPRFRGALRSPEMVRLSEERLQKLLGAVEEVAYGVDSFLLEEHIGSYEVVHFFHSIRSSLHAGEPRHISFRRRFGNEYGSTPGKSYCKNLVDYYESI